MVLISDSITNVFIYLFFLNADVDIVFWVLREQHRER